MKIILASNNIGKLDEISAVLSPFNAEIISQSAAGYNFSIPETGMTFEENAILKAKTIWELSHEAVIADDSGLEVDYLKKAPGIYSHRYAGENATDSDRCNKILEELKDVPPEKRTARFVSVIAFISKNGTVSTVRGECEGTIGFVPIGENGFGYDPIFMVSNKSFAEISSDEKNKISHRALALLKLKEILKECV